MKKTKNGIEMLFKSLKKKGFYSLLIISGLLSAYQAEASDASKVYYIAPDKILVKGEDAFYKGNYQEAVALFTMGLKRDLSEEQIVSVQNALCASENALGNWSKAISHCAKAISKDRSYWQAYINLGHSYNAQGDKTKAYEQYCAAYALAPNHVSGSFTRSCS